MAWLVFIDWVMSYANEWGDYSSYFWEGVEMGDRNQDHPYGKEMQKSKMAVWGGLTNSMPARQEILVRFLGRKDPRKKG